MRPQTLKPVALFAVTILCFAIAGAGLPRKLAANTINPIATLDRTGCRISLSGPFTCTQVEWVAFRVTVTQRTTGAVAEGYAVRLGATTSQQWQVLATARSGAAFEPGPATAVAVALSTLHGDVTDAHQWLVPVTLQAE